MRNECIPLGGAREGSDRGILAEVDTMSQVSCKPASCLYLFQSLWFDSCFRAVLQVPADRVWLPSVKFQTWELEAHCERKVALKKKKYVYYLNRNS